MNLSNKTCCVIDNGGFPFVAERLARDFCAVLYTRPMGEEFPKSYEVMVGEGMPNVTRLDWQEAQAHMDGSLDLYVFPDVNSWGDQNRLRGLGARVWGMGRAEQIETDRWHLGELLEKLDMARPDQELIKGTEALGKYLRTAKDKYIKINRWRGDLETFHHHDWFTSAPWFADLEAQLGVLRHMFEFVAQDPIPDAVEVAIDDWTIDGQNPESGLVGYEVKDLGYIGHVRSRAEQPELLVSAKRKLAPFFREHNSRGFFSAEGFVTAEPAFYLTDPCCRCGSPPSQLQCEIIKNYSEVLYAGSGGEIVEPEWAAPYGCVAIIESKADNPRLEVPIDVPKEWRNFVKFRDVYHKDGKIHVLPQGMPVPQIGAIVGLGDSAQEAFDMPKEIADSVKGYGIKCHCDSFAEAEKVIKDGRKLGVDF